MTDLEYLVMTEARRQGYQPDQHAIRQAGIDLAGSSMTSDGLIAMPGLGSIAPADFVRSLRRVMPTAFSTIDDKPQPGASDDRPAGNLTAAMCAEVSANRKQSLPDDWQAVRAKYATGTTTARYMEEIAANRRTAK